MKVVLEQHALPNRHLEVQRKLRGAFDCHIAHLVIAILIILAKSVFLVLGHLAYSKISSLLVLFALENQLYSSQTCSAFARMVFWASAKVRIVKQMTVQM